MESFRRRTCRTSCGGRGISSCPASPRAWVSPLSPSYLASFDLTRIDVEGVDPLGIGKGGPLDDRLAARTSPAGLLLLRAGDLLLPVHLDGEEADQAVVHSDPPLQLADDGGLALVEEQRIVPLVELLHAIGEPLLPPGL